MRVALGLLVLLSTLAACEAPPPREPVAKSPIGLRGWRTLESPWFTIVSDVDEASLRGLAADLERFVGIVRETTSFEELAPRRPTRILVFREAKDFALVRFAPNAMGEYTRTRETNLMYFAHSSASTRTRAILFHEFVHHLLRNTGEGSYPIWYEEGLAELLGSVTWRDDAIAIGMIPPMRKSAFDLDVWIPLKEVLAARSTHQMGAKRGHVFYAQSWALVHYFHTVRGERWEQLQDFLGLQSRGIFWRDAFTQSFDVSVDELEVEFRAHWESLRERIRFFNLWAGALDVNDQWSISAVPPAGVAVQLVELRMLHHSNDPILARSIADAGLRTDPADVRLLAWSARLAEKAEEPARADADIAAALAARPDDAFAHLVRGQLRFGRAIAEDPIDAQAIETARSDYRRSAVLDPSGIEAIAQLGLSYVEPAWGGEAADGLAALERVKRTASWSPDVEFGLGAIKARLGREREALQHLESVFMFAGDPELSEAAGALIEALTDPEL